MKKILMAISMLLLLTMMPLALFSCNSSEQPTEAPTEAPTEKPTEAPTDAPTEEPTEEETKDPYADVVLKATTYTFSDEASVAKIKRLGRTMLDATKGICFDHTATGIEFNAVVEGNITIDLLCEAVNDNEAYLTIYVDGAELSEDMYSLDKDANGNGKRIWSDYQVSEGESTLTIATGLKKGEHNIRIVKQTEANYSLLSLKSLNMTGYLLDKPADKEYYIEFIGDSLTCGMGAAGNATITGGGSAQGMNGADWEDATKGYAFLTAETLGADYSMVSESGIGVVDSWFDPIKDFYTKYSYKRDAKTNYDFAKKPDLVVINLGTNDHYLNQDKDATIVSRLKIKAIELMNTVREKYGEDTPILWVSGIWNIPDSTISQIDEAVSVLGGEANGIYRLVINKNPQNNMGAENHPSIKGHQQTAKEVVEYINSKGLLD